ncbi:NAD(P)-dependent oxidoreductase [Psychrobacillus sp. OK032]|uniref:NAD(P)-dependent oxidoreductase n=1 Tax=Psychrobacillus sp. OK032 TaxID=1884358 RepID=UPI0008BFB32C|nr:NAD(P)-dependent oxidoreductase [Psychrobacillus sp. OK032]SER52578.1 dipicolinate synthase subunit A [Psychrobacillus sp. OK032]
MKKKCVIIGTDLRLSYFHTAISRDLNTKLVATMTWDEELKDAINQFEPQILFLPIQPLKMERPFILPDSCEVLFVGKKNEEINQEIERRGDIQVFSYLEDEQYIWDNANLTAEGFISYFYTHEKQAIYNKQFIITGYGRVGKRLAYALHHLGAKVVISVRSEHQLFEAKSYGYAIETLENLLDKPKNKSAYLINTIPSRWLENTQAASFKRVFDLASNPGCLIDSEGNIPTNYSISTSLPGMYFPQDAGLLIAQSVQNHLSF